MTPAGTRIGLMVPTYDGGEQPGHLRRIARLAEDLGFDDIWIPDHLIFPLAMADAIATAGVCIGATTRIGVCFGVLQVGLRHPVQIGRAVSSLAAEAGDRLTLGLGVGGDYTPEWDAIGASVAQRGELMDELLGPIAAMANGEPCRHDGALTSFDVPAFRPAGRTRVPVWLGARRSAAIKRAAVVDGWLGLYRTPEAFAEDVVALAAAAGAIDRPPPEAGISLMGAVLGGDDEARERSTSHLTAAYGVPPHVARRWAFAGVDELRSLVNAYVAAGASRVVVSLFDPVDEAWPQVAESLQLSED